MRFSKAHRKKLSEAAKLAFKEGRRKVVRAWLGKKQPKEMQEKKRKAMLGRFDHENHPQWKGKKVKYAGLHNWVRRHKGSPSRCDGKKCTGVSKRYEWASKSGEYLRDLSDWIRLCKSCHMKKDYKKGRLKKNVHRLKIT